MSFNSSKRPVLSVLGCGTMGVAILKGIHDTLDGGCQEELFPNKFLVTCSRQESKNRLNKTFERDDTEVHCGDNVQVAEVSDVVLLCCKPQGSKAILTLPGMKEALKNKCLISICAGVTILQMQEWLDSSTHVMRAMPNTPCKIRQGMTVLSPATNVDQVYQQLAFNIFSTLGRCRVLEEKHMDAVTALSGSGPAFGCVILEAFADGGVMMGLPRDVAIELAAQAMNGAARMVLETGAHPAEIKDGVTTPAGSTIAGLLTMEDGKIRSTLARTIQEATNVASTLGRKQS
ncbi:putative PRO3-delta 1-pyrroline-5-carboxylate reductase [Umbelopsis sp. PMI_123]|nr:putative PRO3-delta 1-pyrroline-5-carboxylate reductase [Umbelopsis sp. PMI_123]